MRSIRFPPFRSRRLRDIRNDLLDDLVGFEIAFDPQNLTWQFREPIAMTLQRSPAIMITGIVASGPLQKGLMLRVHCAAGVKRRAEANAFAQSQALKTRGRRDVKKNNKIEAWDQIITPAIKRTGQNPAIAGVEPIGQQSQPILNWSFVAVRRIGRKPVKIIRI